MKYKTCISPQTFPRNNITCFTNSECVYNVHKTIQNKNVICLALLLICFSLCLSQINYWEGRASFFISGPGAQSNRSGSFTVSVCPFIQLNRLINTSVSPSIGTCIPELCILKWIWCRATDAIPVQPVKLQVYRTWKKRIDKSVFKIYFEKWLCFLRSEQWKTF